MKKIINKIAFFTLLLPFAFLNDLGGGHRFIQWKLPLSFSSSRRELDSSSNTSPIRSYYVPMHDGVRIAVDVILPAGKPAARKFPAVLEMTRYWRRREGDSLTEEERNVLKNGFAVVTGDVRGTGASFGIWPYHRSRAETLDFGELITWIVNQNWSDGKVVGYGVSYSANTADWMPERENAALKAIAPRFPDYDPYADLYFPGGIRNRWMAETWGKAVKEMDLNEEHTPDGKLLPGVRPVDDDKEKRLLADAVAQRRNTPSVWEGLKEINFRDDQPATWHGASMNSWGIYTAITQIEHSKVPMQTWGSWFDSGVANGVLHRFMTQSNPQRSFIGAWTHGGFRGASPFQRRGAPADPPFAKQQALDIDFFHRFVDTSAPKQILSTKLLSYYTIGEERWKTTSVWPLPQTQYQSLYFGSKHVLKRAKPEKKNGSNIYNVDFSATTGNTNRWHTNGGVEEVWYGNRDTADRKLLTYTSDPLAQDMEITGQPIADLFISSDNSDGAFFVYIEDVDKNGFVRYITEGELRGIDRKISSEKSLYQVLGPYHTFLKADAMPLAPGHIAELKFSLMPISVLIRAGHCLRIALAGADANTFSRIPQTGNVTLDVECNRRYSSKIILPIIQQKKLNQ